MTDNVTITPIYEQSHIIIFEPNNGEQTTDTSINDGQAIGTFPTVVRETCTGTEGDYVERGCSEVFILDGWYLESDFQTKIDETYIPSSDITVYAKWNKVYSTYNQLVFDGTNYLDTEVELFSEENIKKNFELSFELTSYDPNQTSQATIINSMVEKSPYPGFVFRFQTNNTQVEFNSPKISSKNNMSASKTNKISIKRENDIYYLKVNDGNYQKLGTYSGTTFDNSTVIGASLDENGNPWRFFKGKLKNMNIKIYD